MRILYVEDNETNQALVGRVVRAKKHSIVYRDEGEGALELLAADSEIDLILLDIELAGVISGLDVVKTLRGRDDHRPIVAVTAYAMMGDRERILAAGCDQYLPKPLVITDLLALMEHYETGEPLPASLEVVPEPPAEPAPDAPVTMIHEPLAVPAPEIPAESTASTLETPVVATSPATEAAAPETPVEVAPVAQETPVNVAPIVEEKPVVISVPVPAESMSVVTEARPPQPNGSNGDIVA